MTAPTRGPVVAIDGPAGSGKSTVARCLAERVQIPYLSTGSLYRGVAYAAGRAGLDADVTDSDLSLFLDRLEIDVRPNEARTGFDVTVDKQIVPETVLREEQTGRLASQLAARQPVRDRLLVLQRRSAGGSGAILEGRDIGSVVFPDAEYKFFITADPAERARRRCLELGLPSDDPAVLAELVQRDERDTLREASPLVVPNDAVEVDTTGQSVEQVVEILLKSTDFVPDSR